ncbi:MAG: class I SAM-dependent methyltransferase [Kofleriaceae bacterium]|nr:class I SAM-dependent methyltransferase [Kofleriaceae bacterium]
MTAFRRFATFAALAFVLACAASPTTNKNSNPNMQPATTTTPPATITDAHTGHATHGDGHSHGHHGDGHGGMQHSFAGPEQWTKVFDDPARDAWQKPDEVVALMGITSAMTVADLGAGTGYFAGRLARAAATGHVLAVDVEPSMVEYLKARGQRDGWRNVTAQLATATDPTLPAASVDRILIVDVWHHLNDRPAYAAKIAQALKPGGAVFVVDFEMDSPIGPGKAHRLLASALAVELQTAGLTTSLATESLPHQYIVIGRKP